MDGLESLRERMEALAGLADVDPAVLSGDKALEWATRFVRVRDAIDALAAPFVSRVEPLSQGPSRFARWKGFGSTVALVSSVTGLAPSDAHRLLALGTVMNRTVEVPAALPHAAAEPLRLGGEDESIPPAAPSRVPEAASGPVRFLSPLAQAERAGRLSPEQVRIIEVTVAAMTIDTTQFEADAVAKAAGVTHRQLRVWCQTEFSRRDPDGYEARQDRQRGERYFALSPQADGMVKVSGMLDAATAAPVFAWFGPQARAAMAHQRGWDEGEKLSVGQINADVLASLCRHAAAHGL